MFPYEGKPVRSKSIGRALHALDRRHEAIADYELALSISPRDPGLHVRRGWAAIDRPRIELEQRDFDLAARHAAAALTIDRNNAAAHDLMGAIRWIGAAQWHESDLKSALSFYDRAIALKPNAPSAHWHRFQLLRDTGHTTEALAETELILGLPDITKPGAVSYYVRVHTSFRTAA